MPRAPLPISEFEELALLVRSHHPLIVVQVREVERLEVLLEYLCAKFALPLFNWAPGAGLVRHGQRGSVYGSESLLQALAHVRSSPVVAIYHFNLAGEPLGEPRLVSLLLDVSGKLSHSEGALVLSFCNELPVELEPLAASIAIEPPTTQEYYEYLRGVLSDVRTRQQVFVQLSTQQIHELLAHAKGLTLLEMRRLVTSSMVEHGALDERAIFRIAEAKGRSVAQSTVLEYFPVESGFEQLAGLSNLRRWLDRRGTLFRDPARAERFGLSPPRGVLLLGVQGCGKSQTAKAVAASWKLPMLRLDAGRLYDKYVGATERNLDRALRMAEQLSPCVLWVDEIEKALAQGGSGDGGTSQRVLATFLTWLQERHGSVFVVATANDISRLPPELLRKGRFDEIFFVDLPNAEVRKAILRVHLERRKRRLDERALARLAEQARGMSGSELEQVVISGLLRAFHEGGELTADLLSQEIAQTVPLSVTMAEPIEALRQWAASRTTPAD